MNRKKTSSGKLIGNEFDRIDDEIIVYMEHYLNESKKNILWQCTKQLVAGTVKSESIKVTGIKKYKSDLRSYLLEAIQIGIESVKKELEIKDLVISINNRCRKWVNCRINNLVDKQIEDIIFQIVFGIEDILQLKRKPYSNQDVLEALDNAESHFTGYSSINIRTFSYNITQKGISTGRSLAAEKI